MKSLRHGDWTFHSANTIPEGAKKLQITGNSFTFAEGEATGHLHTLHVPSLEDMEWYKMEDGSYAVVVKKEGYATHPEHSMKNDLVIPVGTYIVRQRREKDWFSLSVRKVID